MNQSVDTLLTDDAEEGSINFTRNTEQVESQNKDLSLQDYKNQSTDCHPSAIGSTEAETAFPFGCDSVRDSSLVTEAETVLLSDKDCIGDSIESSLAGKMKAMTVDNTANEEASSASLIIQCCTLEEENKASAGTPLEMVSFTDCNLSTERSQEKEGGEFGCSGTVVNLKTADASYVLGNLMASEDILNQQDVSVRKSLEKESLSAITRDDAGNGSKLGVKMPKARDDTGETKVNMPISVDEAGMEGMLEVYLRDAGDGAGMDRKLEVNLPNSGNDARIGSKLEVRMPNAVDDGGSGNKLEVNMANAEDDAGGTGKLEVNTPKEELIRLEMHDRNSVQEVKGPVQQILLEDRESIKNIGWFVNCDDNFKVSSSMCTRKNLTDQIVGKSSRGTDLESRIEEVSDLTHGIINIDNCECDQEDKGTKSDCQNVFSNFQSPSNNENDFYQVESGDACAPEEFQVDKGPVYLRPRQEPENLEVQDDVKTELETTVYLPSADVCGPVLDVVQILEMGSNCRNSTSEDHFMNEVETEITDVVKDVSASIEFSESNLLFAAKPEEVTAGLTVTYSSNLSKFISNSSDYLSQVERRELEGEEIESGNLEGIVSTNVGDSAENESCMEHDTQAIGAEMLEAKLDNSQELFLESSDLNRSSNCSLDDRIVDTKSCLVLHNMDPPGSIDTSNSSCEEIASVHLRVQNTVNACKKRIDLGHQFVREIVKIQHGREQYERQRQASKQENQHRRKLEKMDRVGKIDETEDEKRGVNGVLLLNARMNKVRGPLHTEGTEEGDMSVKKSLPAARIGVVYPSVSESNSKAGIYFHKAESIGEHNEFGRKNLPNHEVNRVRDRKLSNKGQTSLDIAAVVSEGGMHFDKCSPVHYGKDSSHHVVRNDHSAPEASPRQSSKHQRSQNKYNAFHIGEGKTGRFWNDGPVYRPPTVKTPSAPSTHYETNAYFDELDGEVGSQCSSGPSASGSKSSSSNATSFQAKGLVERRNVPSGADSEWKDFSYEAVEAAVSAKLSSEKRALTNNNPRLSITESMQICGVPGQGHMKDVTFQSLQLVSESAVSKLYFDSGRENSSIDLPMPNAHKIVVEDANKFVVSFDTKKQQRRIGYLNSSREIGGQKSNLSSIPPGESPKHELSKKSVYHGQRELAGTVPSMVPVALESSFRPYQFQAASAGEHFSTTIQKQGAFGGSKSKGRRRHLGNNFREETYKSSKGDPFLDTQDFVSNHISDSFSLNSSLEVKDSGSNVSSSNKDCKTRILEVVSKHEPNGAIIHDEFEESWSSPSFPINSLPKVKSTEAISSKPRRWGDVDEGEEMEFGPLKGGTEQNWEIEGIAEHDYRVSGATENIQTEMLHLPRQLITYSETNKSFLADPPEKKYFTDRHQHVESGMVVEDSPNNLPVSGQSSVKKSVWERLGPREVAVDMSPPSKSDKPIHDDAGILKTPAYRSSKFDKAHTGNTSRGRHVDQVIGTHFRESNYLSTETREAVAAQAHKDDKPKRGKLELYVPRRSSRKY